MEQTKGKFRLRSHYVTLLAAILMIAAGLFVGVSFAGESRRVLIQRQEDNLYEVARSTDRNITNLLKRCQDEIFYMAGRTEFSSAEQRYILDGASSGLWFCLRDNTLILSNLISAIVAIEDGETVLSSHMEYLDSYRFFSELGSDTLKLCTDSEGNYYLAFLFRGTTSHIRYAALMDLEAFYRQIVGSEVQEEDSILLYNEEFDLLLSNDGGRIRVDRPRDPDSRAWNTAGIAMMRSYLSDPEHFDNTREYTNASGGTYQAYVTVYPVRGSSNGIFTVALVAGYDALIQPLTRFNMYLLICAFVIILGLAVMFYGIYRIAQDQAIRDRQLEELRARNDAMEGLLKKTKELEHIQRLETIGTMTSGIAHEFNNLLTPIMGYSIMILEKLPEEDTEISDGIIAIYNSSRKAKEIIQRLSDLSRKNAPASLQPIGPDELIRKVVTVAAPSKPKPVEIKLELNAGEHRLIGNETQLTQVLLNLIINAFHAMEENGGTLRLSTRYINVTDEIVFQISDTGKGIPPEVLPHIFDPFFTTKEAGKGTGLGLSIVRNVVESYNGSIDVKSISGKGSQFTIRLPAET